MRMAIAKPPEEAAPLEVPGYELIESLGRGGMGEVFRARQISLDREVAVKVLRAELSASGWLPERFEREARTMASLRHPHLVTVHDCVRLGDGQLAIVMEYVCGGTLREKLKVSPQGLPLELAIRWIREIAEGLHAAHGAGIIHRDVKPENVLIDHIGHARVSDFGMAFSAGTDSTRYTQTGTALGTVGYMAPEQLRGQEVDVRSDIFSLGVMCYEMLTGHLPQGSFSPVRELRPEVPIKLERFVVAALRPDTQRRPEGLVGVIAMLREVERQPAANGLSRRKWVAAAGLAFAGGGGAWWWLGRNGGKDRGETTGTTLAAEPIIPLAPDGVAWQRVAWPENPAAKAVKGGWRLEKGVMVSDEQICILPLMQEMPQAWMARMRFRRMTGINSVEFFIRTQGGVASVLLSGWSQGKGGVQLVNNRTLMEEGAFTLSLENERVYDFTIEVRPERIRMWVDGALMNERYIKGATLGIAAPWEWQPDGNTAALGIGSWRSSTRFEWVEWRPL